MKKQRKIAAVAAQLDALYARLPAIACQGRCTIACGFIVLFELEAERLRHTTHQRPRVVHGNRCVYLTPAGRCSAYAVRPLICRAYGLVHAMSCPYGCTPDRWLEDLEFVALAQEVERLAGRLLRMTESGLVHVDGDSFLRMVPRRDAAAIERDSQRTRDMRALHGGRVLAVIDHTTPGK